jgi:extracellular factor (EF) 3-hydroxypalmitic acid methyl ester biosynthesis protein
MGIDDSSKETLAPSISTMIQKVLPFAGALTCSKQENLIATGEQADCFYYVESGKFEVSYWAQQTPIVVALIGPDHFFGEIGYFDQLARTRHVQAIEDAVLRVFNASVMAAIRTADPHLYADFMQHLLGLVCHRFRQVLSDRGPLSAFAASLSTGREHFQGLQALPADLLRSEQWQQVSCQIEDLKTALFAIAYRLQKDDGEPISPDLLTDGEELLDRFKEQVRHYPDGLIPEHLPLMWGFAFKELFPYFMRSRFAERAYYKPKGYAGDFMMMELIYRQRPEGDGKLGRLIDGWLLKQTPAQAVCNRRRLMVTLLDTICSEKLKGARSLKVMNLACGPSRELFDLLVQCDYSHCIDALCIDIDAEALQYVHQQVNTAAHQARIRLMHENVIKWALGRTSHDLGYQDIIYCSGLCDYLDRRLMLKLIERCYSQLASGGVLILGNFSPTNPDRLFMDNILYWRLIYRDEQNLRAIFSDSAFGRQVEVVAEEHGVNLFVMATKQ